MKCPHCGADSIGKFCEYCGSELPYNGPQSVQNSYKTENITHVTNVYYVKPDELPSWDQPAQPAPYHKNAAIPAAEPTGQFFNTSPKNKSAALLLCLFLGIYGGHLFYVGRWKKTLLYLFTGGLFSIGWLIDIIAICTNNFTDAAGRKISGKAKAAWIIIVVVILIAIAAGHSGNSGY